MSWGAPWFVIAIIAISTAGWMFTSWVRARHGYPVEDEWGGKTSRGDLDADRKLTLLAGENDKLHGQVARLEERIAVLERIATDTPSRLSAEIENLR